MAIDSGHFMGYPAMYLRVPDERAFVFTQAFQAVGLGLASAIGAAVARPGPADRGRARRRRGADGLADLETVARLGLRMLIVVYNDAAYGAEVHHFGPHGHPLDIVQFPGRRLRRAGPGGRPAGRHRPRRAADLEAVTAGWHAAIRPAWCWTPKSSPRSSPSGWRKPSAAIKLETMTPEERLTELRLALPQIPPSIGNYVGAVRTGNLVYLSGKGPIWLAAGTGRASSAPSSPLRRATRPRATRC